MKSNTIRIATFLALSTAVISGVSNFINKLAVTAVKDPILYTTLKNGLVGLGLLGLILLFNQAPAVARLTRRQAGWLLAIGLVGGSLPFALYFTGLMQTSAINASLIHKTLFVWVLLFAIPFLKEKISGLQWLGIAAVFAANLLIGGFTGFKFNSGEGMILAADILWGLEMILAKRVLTQLPALTVAGARMVLGTIFLLPILWLRGTPLTISTHLSAAQWQWTLLASVLLFGYVTTWYAALKRAPATYVAVLLVPATLVTNILSAVFLTHSLNLQFVESAGLFVVGTSLFVLGNRLFVNNYKPAAVSET